MNKKLKTDLILWIDVDDVLLEFRPMFNQFLRETYGFKIDNDYMAKTWTYDEIIPEGDDFMNYFNSLPVNWTENQVPFPFVKKYLNEIKKMGHHIIFITAVPEHVVHYRLKNLISHNLYFDEIYFTSQSKSVYAKEVLKRFRDNDKLKNILIDDRAKNGVDFHKNIPNMEKIVSLKADFNSHEMKNERIDNISYHHSTLDMWEELMKYLRNR